MGGWGGRGGLWAGGGVDSSGLLSAHQNPILQKFIFISFQVSILIMCRFKIIIHENYGNF